MDTNPSISSAEKQIVCPSDNIIHTVVLQSLPLCFAIMQHLPGVKESKEFAAAFLKKGLGGPAKNSDNESIRKEFKSVFKKATEEYK